MGKKDVNVLLSVLALCLALAFALVPRTEGGQSPRGECQKDCEVRYLECRDDANADPEACEAFFDACKRGCRAALGNTNGNTNGNGNGNLNTNGNGNSNGNFNTNGNMNGNSNGNFNSNGNGNFNSNGNVTAGGR